MILHWQRKGLRCTDGGKTLEISIINISLLFLVLFFNLSDQYEKGQDFYEYLLYVWPFGVLLILSLLFKNSKKLHAIIFLILAIGTTIDPANDSDYSGAIFFIYSFHIINKHWYAVFVSVVSIACLTVRSIVLVDTVPGTLIMIAVFAYIYSIYYFLIFKPMKRKPAIHMKDLSREENRILECLSVGLSQKEAATKMGIRHTKAAYLIKQIKEKTGYTSLNQLFFDQ